MKIRELIQELQKADENCNVYMMQDDALLTIGDIEIDSDGDVILFE